MLNWAWAQLSSPATQGEAGALRANQPPVVCPNPTLSPLICSVWKTDPGWGWTWGAGSVAPQKPVRRVAGPRKQGAK
jgi:hypothetical protein